MPPTSKEDATTSFKHTAKSPMNMYRHKKCWNRMLKHTHMNIYHAQMQTSIRHSGNIIHLSKHSFYMFITFINRNIVAEVKMDKITYLMKTPSATSYVTATFHPTIGQRAP